MLVGADPLDPAVFAASTGVLILAMLAARVVPARRAARVEPQVALREE